MESYAKDFSIIESTSVDSRLVTFGNRNYTVTAEIKDDAKLEEIVEVQKQMIEDKPTFETSLLLGYGNVSFPIETPEETVAFLIDSVDEFIVDGEVETEPLGGYINDGEFEFTEITYFTKDRASMMQFAGKLGAYPEANTDKLVLNVGTPDEQYTVTYVRENSRNYEAAKLLDDYPETTRFYIADSFIHVEFPNNTADSILSEVKEALVEINNAHPEADNGYPWEIEVVRE